jgi:hypothetical protein
LLRRLNTEFHIITLFFSHDPGCIMPVA